MTQKGKVNQLANEWIKTQAKQNKVFLWEIAQELGIADATLSRHMRREITGPKREQVERAIRTITASRKQEG